MRKNIKGQVVIGEYIIILFVVIGVASAMSIFFRRAVQARIKSSRDLMAKQIVSVGNKGDLVGKYYVEYEPYYAQTEAETENSSESQYSYNAGGSEKRINEQRSYSFESKTEPPGETD